MGWTSVNRCEVWAGAAESPYLEASSVQLFERTALASVGVRAEGLPLVLPFWVGAWQGCRPPLGCAEGVQALGKKGFLRAK